MKKTLILLCFMVTLLLCSLTIVSCENSGTKDTETETETEAPIILTDEEKEEVRAKLRSMYDVTTDDAFILNDNVAYHCSPSGRSSYNVVIGDYSYGDYYEDKNDNQYASYYNIYDRKDVTVLCNIEGCKHDGILCPAHIPADEYSMPIITIFPQSGGNPVMYFIGKMRQTLSYGGVSVNINIDSQDKNAIFEFNTQTGTRRTAASCLPFSQLYDAIYYNGIIYGTCDKMYSEVDEETNERISTVKINVYSVDVATGEYKEFENDCNTTVGGVWEGKLYLIDVMGNIYRCNPDFSEVDIIANVGEENTYITGGMELYQGQFFYVSDGRLYYSRDRRTYTDETVTDGIVSSTYRSEVFKLYTIDLTSDNLTPTLIDDKVLEYYVYNDMLYYTTFDYKFYGYYTTPGGSVYIDTDNGGNLYMYNPKTGKTDVILRDCGGDIDSIEEITDEYITFYGIYYAGLESGYEYKGNNCRSLMRYYFKENKLTIIRDIN